MKEELMMQSTYIIALDPRLNCPLPLSEVS
jgi:hypothetical protein